MRVHIRSALALSAALAIPPASAEDRIAGPVEASLTRVIDGDTIEVRAHLWLGLELTTRVRLADIDAPELDGGCSAEREVAKTAREFLAGSLSAAITLRDIRHDKYGGRVVARVFNAQPQNVGELLLSRRLAVPTGTATAWCR
jgi:endonuclease YncB( thermonuclease family)